MPSRRPVARLSRWLRALTALATVAPAVVRAQQIRGVVRDSAAQAPLPAVAVLLFDSSGAPLGRTVTDASGRYAVTRSMRAARLHAVRIGYHPYDVALGHSARDTTVDFTMSRIPPILDAVKVSDRELCPGSDDRGPAFQLWEQARAGLMATVVAREAKPATASTLMYERAMLPNDDLVREQTQRVKSGRTTRPFVASASPETFARRGYVIDDPTGRLFSAPDADVLLDPSFAATHCFHLQRADADHRDQVGLAFVPVTSGGRDTLVDVSGVIWIARATPELRSLDFRFTALEPAAMRAGAGGHLEFHTAANGVSFIKWWYMRLPMLRATPSAARAVPNMVFNVRRRQDREDVYLAEMHESGGIVLEARWDDGTTWQDPATGISGTITEKGSGKPATRSIATVEGTTDTVTTNEHGTFSLVPLPPGRYSIVLADTALQAYTDVRRQTRQITVARGSVANVRAEVPAIRDIVTMLCSDLHQRPLQSSTTTIAGRIAPQGEPLGRKAKVRAQWQADFEQSQQGTKIVKGQQESDVDDHGRFLVCGVALDRPVNLHVDVGSRGADTTVITHDTLLANVDWAPRLHGVAVQTIVLRGTVVRDGSNAPVGGAVVTIPSQALSATTSSTGAFELAGVSPGNHEILIRHVGDSPLRDSVSVTSSAASHTFRLGRAVALDTVRANAAERRYVSPALRGFEERRRLGIGTFITDSVLRANDDHRLSDVLRLNVPSMRVLMVRSDAYATSGRDMRSSQFALGLGAKRKGNAPAACYATVYLDGVMLFDLALSRPDEQPPNLSDFQVDRLGAVEYYGGGAAVPAQFRSSECGTLLLWTREK